MGRVKPKYIKSLARRLLETYPDKFTDSFEENKKAVAQLADIPSKTVRNKVAGYITRLVKRLKTQEKTESAA
ncbi:SSU ribosomal protein S17E [Pyrobaculum islandicum DSM 4184]|uniref:Small ribosomal subunit protein eS17 n=1 Tax=Pyrobaculum islandicum (strain DSM 4184 / JCM 9189 / GEO3) TaxID=384616 RepID=RS17E_PYRIL|nr:30S ribosomal protein S17e [Pyrobaculum islandicum]A1RTI5.1 RecName: Full=Small ribosomal subunit protein eS17; AltName: Full=30S ribosomal protein S17e [Pyrobaculum islandicum DSM 4184]ABL88267.1 SSU ribosomal protein S17E [Pyrobaculum islandicum DSM 4184]